MKKKLEPPHRRRMRIGELIYLFADRHATRLELVVTDPGGYVRLTAKDAERIRDFLLRHWPLEPPATP